MARKTFNCLKQTNFYLVWVLSTYVAFMSDGVLLRNDWFFKLSLWVCHYLCAMPSPLEKWLISQSKVGHIFNEEKNCVIFSYLNLDIRVLWKNFSWALLLMGSEAAAKAEKAALGWENVICSFLKLSMGHPAPSRSTLDTLKSSQGTWENFLFMV